MKKVILLIVVLIPCFSSFATAEAAMYQTVNS